ncbi:hypothetical protein [Limnospira indica]|uniref:hypothetical protein n=2 Tax=Limnospira TaxID=2596745 RepID=UPI001861A1E6|nr:hypothetical protein [Limnospira indica]QNH60063.1 MAG: hypothetical protein H2674_13645 [Limnospira indica BM01]
MSKITTVIMVAVLQTGGNHQSHHSDRTSVVILTHLWLRWSANYITYANSSRQINLIFSRLLRIVTILSRIGVKKLTRLWGLCYHQINRTQGVTMSTRQNIGYNPHSVARKVILPAQIKNHDARVFRREAIAFFDPS